MICARVNIGGVAAIVCTSRPRRRKCACGQPAPLECDWKVPTKKSGTCDAPICAGCTHSPAPGKDLCQKHAAEWKARTA